MASTSAGAGPSTWRSSPGSGSATIGAILGSAILLAGTLREPWQFAVLAGAAATGLLVALAGGPLPH
jgi:chromate transporter